MGVISSGISAVMGTQATGHTLQGREWARGGGGGRGPSLSGDSNRTNERSGFCLDRLLSDLLRTSRKPAVLGENC